MERVPGLQTPRQAHYLIEHKGVYLGNSIAGLLVESRLVVELKCVDCFSNEHSPQALNYLRASNLELASLTNFQKPKVESKRLIP